MAELPPLSPFGVKLNFKAGSAGRNEKGQYVSVTHRELEKLSEKLAKQVQADAVENLKAGYDRPNVRTNRLVRVTADSANRVWDRNGFAVGIESHLDRSEAKYWRTIEEGSAATWRKRRFVGMELWGNWGATLSGWRDGAGGRHPNAGPAFSRSKEGAGGGMFAPYGDELIARLKARGAKPTVIGKDIRPHHYYQRAWEDARFEVTFVHSAEVILGRAVATAISPAGY